MTKEDLAALLNGREYLTEITGDEIEQARQAGLVAVFGFSDESVVFRGAFNEEVDACGAVSQVIHFDAEGPMASEDELESDEVYLKLHRVYEVALEVRRKALSVRVGWDRNGYSWWIETDHPHVVFDILERGDPFCRGVVVDLNAATEALEEPA